METPNTFAAQMKNYFGFRPGDKVADFMKEIKALDENDRAQFTEMLNGAGYPVIAAAKS